MNSFEILTSTIAECKGALFVKLLARNDHVWADRAPGERGIGKQNGVYIPKEIREADFFPRLVQRGDKPHIFDVKLSTFWPQAQEASMRQSNLVNYSNKGSETHFTRLPKEVFSGLGPSSMMVMSKKTSSSAEEPIYVGLVIPSGTQEYDDACDLLNISPGFLFGMVDIPAPHPDAVLAEQVLRALLGDTLHEFIDASQLPNGKDFARNTQLTYLRESGVTGFDAFSCILQPGDTILELCDIQYRRYQGLELRLRAAEMIQILHKERKGLPSARDTVEAIVSGFPSLLELFKSLRGARASRMGTAFELHIERIFMDSGVPFVPQPKVKGRTPDFILPSLESYLNSPESSFILTAKSTLRERWQQILNEGAESQIYLATLDRSITDQSLADMDGAKIQLVVPEQFVAKGRRGVPDGIYAGKQNVLSFRSFLDGPVKEHLKGWSQ